MRPKNVSKRVSGFYTEREANASRKAADLSAIEASSDKLANLCPTGGGTSNMNMEILPTESGLTDDPLGWLDILQLSRAGRSCGKREDSSIDNR